MTEPIRVLLADDHPMVRAGLRATIEATPSIVVAEEAPNGDVARRLCQDLQPDVLLLDLNMPGPPATATVAFVNEHCPTVKVIVLTAYDDDTVIRGLLAAGIAGYVLKDEAPEALVGAVHAVASGGTWFSRQVVAKLVRPPETNADLVSGLTARELDLLRLLALGWDNKRIAAELSLSEQTVRNYVSRLYGKLGVQTRAEAIVWARDLNTTD